MLRLMVQGDRDAKGIEDAVRRLGTLCKEREIGLNVGESGEIVRLIAESGASYMVNQAQPGDSKLPEHLLRDHTRNCQAAAFMAQEGFHRLAWDSPKLPRLAWCIRLACLDTSDGFIFFPGREGTLAHLVPIMAFIAKGERDKGVARPRRVALVGWPIGKYTNLCELMEINPSNYTWVHPFTLAQVGNVITWLTDGLPAK